MNINHGLLITKEFAFRQSIRGKTMNTAKLSYRNILFILGLIKATIAFSQTSSSHLKLNDSSYFEKQGLNVLVFSNWYNDNFSDSKISGIEIILAITNYFLHKTFPNTFDAEYTFKGLNFIYGCPPGSNISFVSGVGTDSKEDWPFLWGENEYAVNVGASYIFLVNAVNDLLNRSK